MKRTALIFLAALAGEPLVLSSGVPKEMDEVLALVGARSRARVTPSARVR